MATNLINNKEFRKKQAYYSKKFKTKLTMEEIEILNNLETLKKDLDFLYSSFDYVTDPTLIDSYIYEIKSVQMKYQFYLNLCKEQGLNKNFA